VLNATETAKELQEIVAWQQTPLPLTDDDYMKVVIRAVRRFFVDINHPEEYDIVNWTTNDTDEVCYNRLFNVTEETYIFLLCQLEFFKRVQMDVNDRFSYTTNALSVTNADKPYANLQQTINDLEHERRIVFNKMVRYTLGET